MTEQQACTLCGAGGHTAPGIIINGHQLRNALEFLAPDNSSEQLGEDLVIELHAKDEDFPVAGLYAYHNECPEEGAIFLDDTAQHPEQAEGAQGEQELDFTHLSRRMLEELARLGKCLVATADLERLTQERDVAQARVAELLAALERAATAMWNSEANMDIAAADAEEAIGNAKSGTPVAQAGQVPVIQVCKLGTYGKAYDLPETKRAYTYAEQPDNLGASRLGDVATIASAATAGDHIDRGLVLLRELQAKGFGVFELATVPAPGGSDA